MVGLVRTRSVWLIILFMLALMGAPYSSAQGSVATNALNLEMLVPGIDLDVTYISRTPRYDWNSAQPWPNPDEVVVFTAHVINKGTTDCGAYNFEWLIDGIVVNSGTSSGLLSEDVFVHSISWPWQLGRHQVSFRVDPQNLVVEAVESNNTVADYTNALAVGFWVEQSVYDQFNNRINGAGSYSWEDWAQSIVHQMNIMLEKSVYPDAPQGGSTQVRLDKITIAPDGTLFNLNYQHAPLEYETDAQWGFSLEEYDNCSDQCYSMPWWVIHELMHYLYARIDLYALDVQGGDVKVRDEGGNLIAGTPLLPYIAWDVVHYVSRSFDLMHVADGPTLFSDYILYSLNRDWPADNRIKRDDWYYYFLQIPDETRIRVLDNSGQPIGNVQVFVYQAVPGDGSSGPYSQEFDNVADITGVTNSQGIFSLGGAPFGDLVNIGTPAGVLLVKLRLPNGQYQYVWLELLDLNMAYWRGETTLYIHALRFPDGPKKLHLSTDSLVFETVAGFNPRPQKVDIELLGEGVSEWSVAAPGVNWVRTIPSHDFSLRSHPPGPLTVVVESKDLPVGTYMTQVSVSGSTGVADSPQVVNLTLRVSEPRRIHLPYVTRNYASTRTLFVPANLDDAEILNLNCNDWSECRNAQVSNAIWQGLNVGTVGATFNPYGFTIQRIFFRFDTSMIPTNATITRAVLNLYKGQYQNGAQTFHVVQSSANTPPSTSDFGKIQYLSGGSITDNSLNHWLRIDLNPTGIQWILKGGITKLALIHQYDLNNVRPTTGNDSLIALTENTLFQPQLEITFTTP